MTSGGATRNPTCATAGTPRSSEWRPITGKTAWRLCCRCALTGGHDWWLIAEEWRASYAIGSEGLPASGFSALYFAVQLLACFSACQWSRALCSACESCAGACHAGHMLSAVRRTNAAAKGQATRVTSCCAESVWLLEPACCRRRGLRSAEELVSAVPCRQWCGR